jgi:hypothetical protein
MEPEIATTNPSESSPEIQQASTPEPTVRPYKQGPAQIDMKEQPGAEGPELTDDFVPPDLESLSPEQYNEWLQTGKLPEAEAQTPEKPPTSETDKDAKTPESKPPKKNADTRAAQLESEIAELKRQNAERIQKLLDERRQLRQELSQPATPPASQPAAEDDPEPQPPFIDPDEFEGTYAELKKAEADAMQKFLREHEEWGFRRLQREQSQAEAARRQQESIQAANETAIANWQSSLADAKLRYPDFDAKTASFTLPEYPEMDEYIRNSPISAHIAYRLASNREEAERIVELRPQAMKRELGRLEDDIVRQLRTPPTKTITTARPPGTQLSGVNRTAVDESLAAVEADDFARYKAVEDAKEAARYNR